MTYTRFKPAALAVSLAALLVAPQVRAQRLEPADLTYEGLIAPPQVSGMGFGWGMLGLEFDPTCAGQTDPSPSDGYPGCLVGTSNIDDDMVAMFDIPASQQVAEGDYPSVPKGSLVVDFFKCSIRFDGSDAQTGRDLGGVARSEAGQWLCTSGWDWYNVTFTDLNTHTWFDFDPSTPDAEGEYGFGPQGDDEFHSQRMGQYLGSIPQAWADVNLAAGGQPYCFSGMQRGGGGCDVCSGGPTLYSFPCERPAGPAPGPVMSTQQLLGYPNVYPVQVFSKLHPDFSPISQARGVTWIGNDAVLVSALKGGDYWWYGEGEPLTDPYAARNGCQLNLGFPDSCFLDYGPDLPPGTVDLCSSYKGYHALLNPDGSTGPQQIATLQFYDANELAEVASGQRLPESVLPYTTIEAPAELWNANCGSPADLAFDKVNRKLYWVEDNYDNPLVHVYSVGLPAGPDLALSPGTLAFGSVLEGASAQIELTLTNLNQGPEAIQLSDVVSSLSAFSIDPSGGQVPCGSTNAALQAGSSCTMMVTFQPPAAGAFSGALTVTSDQPTRVLPLSGSTVLPCSAPFDLLVQYEELDGAQLREACNSISVGPTVNVGHSGDIDFRAGATVSIGNGFSIADGGRVTIEIDALLLQP